MKSYSRGHLGVVVLGLMLSMHASRAALAIENLKVGDGMPGFSLTRADGAGGEFKSERLTGKIAVIAFWRSRQELSLAALRDLQAVSDEVGADKLRIVGVETSRASRQEALAALAAEKLSFPILLDPKRELYGEVGVVVSPTTLVFDARGVLRFVLASHPKQFHTVIRARIRFLVGAITEQQMAQEVEPAVLKIDQKLAAALRMYNLGRRLQAEGKNEQATKVYEQAVSQYPSLSEAHSALGLMKLATGDLAGAERHFRAELAHRPTSPTARFGQAVILARKGDGKTAEKILLSLLGQRSMAARVRYELGRIYRGRGEVEKAFTFFEDALAIVFPEPSGTARRPRATASVQPQPTSGATTPAAQVTPETTTTGPAPVPTVGPAAPTRSVAGSKPPIHPVEPKEGTSYIGVKGCKKCHFQQWRSWNETKMSKAFELLKPGTRGEIKVARGLDAQKDYTTDPACLACHTTGFGWPGGYPRTVGDSRAALQARERASVGCESCHGPGSDYSLVHKDVQDKKRKYAQSELHAKGQYKVDERVCVGCHNWKGPCIAPGSTFDFAKRKEEGTHKHYQLQFLSE